MATRYWLSAAKAVAQVNTITPASVGIGNTFTVTINQKAITFTATAATVANVTAGLVALLQASTIPEFAEITWEDSTTHVTATGKTEGVPFTQTSSASGGTATNITATTTACSGPNFMNVAANWSGATLPVDGDTVVFADNDVDVLYGLDLNAVTPAVLRIDQDFTGNIGLPRTNANGYPEYRDQFAKWGNSGDAGNIALTIGQGAGTGSPLIKLDFGTGRFTGTILNSGQSEDDDDSAIQLLGSHASNALTVNKGSVGIAENPGETATIATLKVNYTSSPESDAVVYCGPGVTLTNITKSGGRLSINSSCSNTFDHYAGETSVIATNSELLNIYGGRVYIESPITFDNATIISGDGVLDLSRSLGVKDFQTGVKSYRASPSPVYDPFGTATGLVIEFDQIVHPDYGANKTVTIS